MAPGGEPIEETGDDFGSRVARFRTVRGLSRDELANMLGVSGTNIIRWENGTSRPDLESVRVLEAAGFGRIDLRDTNMVSQPRIRFVDPAELREAIRSSIRLGRRPYAFDPAPYVVNGPQNQLEFFETLYQLQEDAPNLPYDLAARRLSLVEGLGDSNTKTAQFLLERPRNNSTHWNPNYGPHGWHRYVGRFPPHLVRALLNHFGASSRDLVCDPFLGSGTTLVECRLLGLRGLGIEICPLSALIGRTKSRFPLDTTELDALADAFEEYYQSRWSAFTGDKPVTDFNHSAIMDRRGNPIPEFDNYEKWLTPEALLGCSIVVEFALTQTGYLRDAVSMALSSRMRSIGNVDVDVVRAEYSRTPRQNVNVLEKVRLTLKKMSSDIKAAKSSHVSMLSDERDINVIEASLLDANIEEESIDCIITSPPYGIESVSYLRTHLLSYRVLAPILKRDPYAFDDKIIGSEYVDHRESNKCHLHLGEYSETAAKFFDDTLFQLDDTKLLKRRGMMMQFFGQMTEVAERFQRWVRPGGRIAFVIGNKRIGRETIPTNTIVEELFDAKGIRLDKVVSHKLKCNNSNSEVPWQERTIQGEHIMLFTRS